MDEQHTIEDYNALTSTTTRNFWFVSHPLGRLIHVIDGKIEQPAGDEEVVIRKFNWVDEEGRFRCLVCPIELTSDGKLQLCNVKPGNLANLKRHIVAMSRTI